MNRDPRGQFAEREVSEDSGVLTTYKKASRRYLRTDSNLYDLILRDE